MLGTAIVLGVAMAASFFDLRKLFKQRWGKEAIVYGVLLLIGTCLSIIAVLSIKSPSPMSIFMEMFKPLSDWMHQHMK